MRDLTLDPTLHTDTDSTTDVAIHPTIIQGGMGVAVSDWRLAAAVGTLGQLGVVSGTALDVVHARRLGDGDDGGHLRRAYAHFPVPSLAARVLDRWFAPGGRSEGAGYRRVPLGRIESPTALRELTVIANFAEVWLAKEGHDGPIGVNYLEKLQLPTPDAVYGAMLAGVDYVLMGAGIPIQIPGLLADLAHGRPVEYRVTVADSDPASKFVVRFDPTEIVGPTPPELARPYFLAIIASNTLATFLMKEPATTPDGFVVEGPSAGGHNAPPRGKGQFDADGQPVYGPRDDVDIDKMATTGLPFWLAGGYADPDRVEAALRAGATGVQVGTAFALCEESAFDPELKQAVIHQASAGEIDVHTDPLASPSGFPFKVVRLPGTVSEKVIYQSRERVCDLGFLRISYARPDGSVGYRCPSEPVATYVAKGGKIEDTAGRMCLCNGLLATVGLGQERAAGPEPAIVTIGDDVEAVVRALGGEHGRWTAADVVAHLLRDPVAPPRR
jgi:NAD(P)H-dependent flavin oxidoreductase YrpB (nitropropane dioxygenase family)